MVAQRLIGADEERSQFWPQMRASIIIRDKELQNGSRTRSAVLNADSKATVDTKIARTCYAILESTRYRGELTFHKAKISNFSSKTSSKLSAKYLSTSDLLFEESLPFKCFLNPIILIAFTSTTTQESSLSIDPLGFWPRACVATLALLLPTWFWVQTLQYTLYSFCHISSLFFLIQSTQTILKIPQLVSRIKN